MNDLIIQKLRQTEHEQQVIVLHAVESGSRAWGFASPDSDFDIRFIYKHPTDHYLNLWDKPDVIEFMTSEDLDGSGWDLAKTLKLLAKSNGSLLEWLFSKDVYLQNDVFLNQMQFLAKECFSPVATAHHYLSTSLNFVEACQQENVKLKSYFYALRAALAAKWIVVYNEIPPVAFAELLPLAPAAIQKRITQLLEVKMEQNEMYLHPKDVRVSDYLTTLIQYNKEHAPKLRAGKNMHAALEAFFVEEVKK
ncbi:nucleotidyltransferase domain-containing protein [uncultured Cytophaga sp.]|uniref:nucleotidyltransferase domain-containing protein n=1 Tax=uncultured Cytophaga sp. TaxID=160238 RepID=UPI0026182B9C|nr:nucleotidyltransferase domain-containing protein [uncultured Cytophaga sp.]